MANDYKPEWFKFIEESCEPIDESLTNIMEETGDRFRPKKEDRKSVV